MVIPCLRVRTGTFVGAIFFLVSSIDGAWAQSPGGSPATPGGMLLTSVDQAIAIGLDRSPSVRAAEAKRQGSLGERIQADSPPNPEGNFEAENFGTGELRGFRQAEFTMGLSQKVETGGKWLKRVRVADAAVALSDRELVIARRDLIRDIRKSYVEVVAAIRMGDIERERAELARDVTRVASERAAVGSDPEIQVRKAEITLATAELAQERARREYDAALRELAALLSEQAIQIHRSQPWFDDIGPAPPAIQGLSDAARRVETGPEWTKWDAEIARNRAAFELERSNAIPDVTFGAGVRRFRDSDDTAFVLGASIPIPVFNRNRGAIQKAAQDIVRAEAEAQLARSNLGRGLVDAEAKLLLAWREAEALRKEILPRAEQAFAFAREGYRAGKYPFLEVLDAQRTFAESRARLIEVLRDLHIQRAEVERLVSADLAHPPAATGR